MHGKSGRQRGAVLKSKEELLDQRVAELNFQLNVGWNAEGDHSVGEQVIN